VSNEKPCCVSEFVDAHAAGDAERHLSIALHVIAQPRCRLEATSVLSERVKDAAARGSAVGSTNTMGSEG
jgi:hypothetical protein